jgi:hypothetical protein
MAILLAARNIGACSLCALAVVASKTISKLSFCLSNPSMPSVVIANPSWRARASPSDSGTMPAMITGRRDVLLLSLYRSSVPMLPDPKIATQICSMNFPYANRSETVPRPSNDACSRSPAPTSTAPQSAPGMMMSPSLRLTSNCPTALASQATATAG